MQRIGGSRRRTRHKLSRKLRDKGKIKIQDHMQTFATGEKVVLSADSSVQRGLYKLRFYGKIGTIKARRGKCYEIAITDGGKAKIVLARPIHLKKVAA